jgi:hypothetical protein
LSVLPRTPFLDRGVLLSEHRRDLITEYFSLVRNGRAGAPAYLAAFSIRGIVLPHKDKTLLYRVMGGGHALPICSPRRATGEIAGNRSGPCRAVCMATLNPARLRRRWNFALHRHAGNSPPQTATISECRYRWLCRVQVGFSKAPRSREFCARRKCCRSLVAIRHFALPFDAMAWTP